MKDQLLYTISQRQVNTTSVGATTRTQPCPISRNQTRRERACVWYAALRDHQPIEPWRQNGNGRVGETTVHYALTIRVEAGETVLARKQAKR